MSYYDPDDNGDYMLAYVMVTFGLVMFALLVWLLVGCSRDTKKDWCDPGSYCAVIEHE